MFDTEEGLKSQLNDALNQLQVARAEIQNLRYELSNLKYIFKNDVAEITKAMQGIGFEATGGASSASSSACGCEFINWKSIGEITTCFPNKRGVPRQATVVPNSQGCITLSSSAMNNPEYSLIGLDQYSHFWILYVFHQSNGPHRKTKVAPPRLGGTKLGVFATRAPHRPCPIGMSLVKLNRIEGNCVYFSGVDMVDGTPVMDIKPYIPQYDSPSFSGHNEAAQEEESEEDASLPASPSMAPPVDLPPRVVEGETRIHTPPLPYESRACEEVPSASGNAEERSAPDGTDVPVQVAGWVTNNPRKYKVIFSERAEALLLAAVGEERLPQLRETITRVLEQDPRSTYLRTKQGSQFYTFRMDGILVSVKFDDSSSTVNVISAQQSDS